MEVSALYYTYFALDDKFRVLFRERLEDPKCSSFSYQSVSISNWRSQRGSIGNILRVFRLDTALCCLRYRGFQSQTGRFGRELIILDPDVHVVLHASLNEKPGQTSPLPGRTQN
jgi:hypothetical protein